MAIELRIDRLAVKTYLPTLLDKNAIQIPTFQRGYVWTTKDVEFFIDSIVKGFPIGNLVFMEIRYCDVHIPVKDMPWSLVDNKLPLYVLDGQQRLLSMIKLFVTAELSIMIDRNDHSLSVCRYEDRNLETHLDLTRTIRSNNLKLKQSSFLKATNCYPVMNEIEEYTVHEMHALMTEHPVLCDKIFKLQERLQYIDMPFYHLIASGDSALKDAIKVFKRINMTGVPVEIEHLEVLL